MKGFLYAIFKITAIAVLCIAFSALSSIFPIIFPIVQFLLIPVIASLFISRLSYKYVKNLLGNCNASILACTLFVLCICIVYLVPDIINEAIFIGDLVHFEINKEYYIEQISKENSNFMRFSWGGFSLSPIEVIYDGSIENGTFSNFRADYWLEQAGKKSEFGTCSYNARYLGNKFFIVRFSC